MVAVAVVVVLVVVVLVGGDEVSRLSCYLLVRLSPGAAGGCMGIIPTCATRHTELCRLLTECHGVIDVYMIKCGMCYNVEF